MTEKSRTCGQQSRRSRQKDASTRPPQSCRETDNFPGPKPVITGKAEGRTACSRSRPWDLALVATLLYCLLLHCPQVGVAFAAEGSAPPQYRFGVTPWQHGQSSDDIRALYKPLLEWLGQKVGAEFIIVGAGGYGETIDLLANELIDLIIEVASGRQVTCADRLGQDDFIPWKRGVSL